ncbi:MAG TPA: flagellar motor protein MotB [Microscillaceae bacterium]|nr:flagellar motor protein MotB [Microscillaceae bacterium]
MNKIKHKIIVIGCLFASMSFITSCMTNFKRGKKKFDLHEFHEAIQYFEKAEASGHPPAQTHYYIAEAYRMSSQMEKALPYYQKAIQAKSREDEARFHYAEALKFMGKYKESHVLYEQYAKNGKNYKLRRKARTEIKSLEKLEKMVKEEHNYVVTNCEGINTSQAEFSPMIHKGKMVFTSARKATIFKGNGHAYLGIYAHDFKHPTKFQDEATLYEDDIHHDTEHDASPTFAHDGSFMIFARSGNQKKGRQTTDLFISRRQPDGTWGEAELLEISSEKAWDASPSISPDGKRLYFSSDRRGGYGGNDIWVANLTSSGRAYNVRNLGSRINTRHSEKFPYVDNQGKLYFSSTGHWGLGGLDLFVATRRDGKIKVKNMGVPFNSASDDFGIIYNTDSTGYFSSNREGGKGNDDIYHFIDKTPKTKDFRYFLAIDVATEDTTTNEDIPLAGSKVEVYEGSVGDKKLIHTFTADAKGHIKEFAVQTKKEYVIKAGNTIGTIKYLTNEEEYSMLGREADPDDPKYKKAINDIHLETTIYLQPVLINTNTPVMEAIIYYDLDKWDIRPDAAKELDNKVLTFLKDNPKIIVELGSHTDERGPDNYNLVLSQKRAKSAVDYLISKGIESDRIKAKGYGETDLKIKKATTETEHQENRRTTIKVIGILDE